MTKVAPVPKGFKTVTPCLTVRGVAQAIEFYKAAFDAEETKRLYNADATWILHAELKIGNSVVFLAEENPFLGILSPNSLGGSATLGHLYVKNIDGFVEKALTAGATEITPIADTYWGDRMGKLADPFGHVWTVASRVENVSAEEIAERVKSIAGIDPDRDFLPELAA